MGYDAAKQHRALAIEVRASRKLADAARWMHDEHKLRVGPDGYHDCVLCAALADYDQTPKAVLDHEPSKE